MLVDALKKHMESLPANDFKLAWAAIEEIEEALNMAGPMAIIALEYTRLRHNEQVAQILEAQHLNISRLRHENTHQGDEIAASHTYIDELKKECLKLGKRVARLKKKSKK